MLIRNLMVLLTLSLFAQTSHAARGGAYFGLVEFDRIPKDTISLGAFYEVPTGGQLSVGIQGEYWKVNLGGDSQVRDLSFAGYGKFYIPTGTAFTPFLQGGLGLHLLKQSNGNYSDSDHEIGLDLALGTLMRLSSVSLGFSYQVRNVDRWDYSQIQVSVSQYL